MEKTHVQKSSTPTNRQAKSQVNKTRSAEKPSYFHDFPARTGFGGFSGADRLTPVQLLQLQHTHGNQAVSRFIQTKLTIGRPDDQYEREADRVADTVMRMPESTPEEEETPVQTKPLAESITPLVQRTPQEEEDTLDEESMLQRMPESESEEEEETVVSMKPIIQRMPEMEAEEGEEEEEEVVATKLDSGTELQRQVEDEDEQKLQAKPLPGLSTRLMPKPVRLPTHSTSPQIQRVCTECEEKMQREPESEEEMMQTKPFVNQQFIARKPTIQPKGVGRQTPQVSRATAANIQSLKGGGSPLPRSARPVVSPTIQPKLKIGQPNDKYEQEADRVAEQVMQMSQPNLVAQQMGRPRQTVAVQRKYLGCEEELLQQPIEETEKEETLKPKLISEQIASSVQPAANYERTQEGTKTIQTPGELTSGGAPLPTSLQKFYEPRLGYDLSGVRIHTGSNSEQSNAAIQAHAFTYKNHIWLGKQKPLSPSFLLAHELAHVIQQNQPKRLVSEVNHSSGAQNRVQAQPLQPLVQRVFYWVPGYNKPLSGPAMHKELTTAIANNNNVDREVAIPNADRAGNSGFDFKGQADFYKANSKIGIYFKENKKSLFRCDSGELLGEPEKLQKNGKPSLIGKKLSSINLGATEFHLGELKPADRDQITFGVKQLQTYEEGIKFVNKQVNCWSKNNPPKKGKRPKWSKNITFKRLSLSIPNRYKYDSSNPRTTRPLMVASFTGGGGAKPGLRPVERSTKQEFNPYTQLERLLVWGDLYALDKGNGIVAYFARPANVETALNHAARAGVNKQRAAEFATNLQHDVIDPLYRAPESVSRLAWRKSVPFSRKTSVNKQAIITAASHLRVQRSNIKKETIVDNFNHNRWKDEHTKFSKKFGKEKSGKNLKTLQFIEFVYKAEESLDSQGIPKPAKKLPPKSKLEIELGKKPHQKGTATRPKTKSLADLYSWLEVWSQKPIKVVGKLRHTFGKSFVKVSQRVQDLRARLQSRLEKTREKQKSQGGKSYAAIAIRAFWRAAVKIGSEVFKKLVALLVDSLVKGTKDKLSKLIPVGVASLQKLAANNFKELGKIERKISGIEKKIQSTIDTIVRDFDAKMEKLREFADKAKKYGFWIRMVAIGLFIVKCTNIFGCIKSIFSKRSNPKVIKKILSLCRVQKKFVDVVLDNGWFNDILKIFAAKVAGRIEALLPKGLFRIFDRTVFSSAKGPTAASIPCAEPPSAHAIAEANFKEQVEANLGPNVFTELIRAMKKFGAPPIKKITIKKIQQIRDDVLRSGITARILSEYTRNIKKNPKGKRISISEFLKIVKTTVRQRQITKLQSAVKSGKFDKLFNKLKPGEFLATPNIANKNVLKSGRVLSQPIIRKGKQGESEKQFGVYDLSFNPDKLNCKTGNLPLTFEKVSLQDINGKKVTFGLEGTTLTGHFAKRYRDTLCK